MFRSDFYLNFYFLSEVQFNQKYTLLTHRPALYQVIQIFSFKVNSFKMNLVESLQMNFQVKMITTIHSANICADYWELRNCNIREKNYWFLCFRSGLGAPDPQLCSQPPTKPYLRNRAPSRPLKPSPLSICHPAAWTLPHRLPPSIFLGQCSALQVALSHPLQDI